MTDTSSTEIQAARYIDAPAVRSQDHVALRASAPIEPRPPELDLVVDRAALAVIALAALTAAILILAGVHGSAGYLVAAAFLLAVGVRIALRISWAADVIDHALERIRAR